MGLPTRAIPFEASQPTPVATARIPRMRVGHTVRRVTRRRDPRRKGVSTRDRVDSLGPPRGSFDVWQDKA